MIGIFNYPVKVLRFLKLKRRLRKAIRKGEERVQRKPMYKSRTVWGGVLVATGMLLVAIGKVVGGEAPLEAVIPQIVEAVGLAVGVLGLRGAIEQLK
jgi:hypothetical protein